ncbi:hypothetical protein K439DRAFT_213584 [Ramaria rubella]|nr:hypothetical protein K439DRAFT_213584 [Ramaria rubella]
MSASFALPRMRGAAVALTVPVIFVIALRLIMSTILQSENRNADNLLKGLIQGIIMYHAILSANQAISIALFLGIGGRLVGDFVTRRDTWKVASTLLGFAFGVVMADIVSYLSEDTEWSTLEVLNDLWDNHNAEERVHRSSHRVARRVSEPRRIEEIPAVFEELSSIDSRSRVGEPEWASDVEKEVAKLRAKALHATGQRRRFREERKWAMSQGNIARAFQLRWQVKKYQALADSFTREADQKLIEADRAKRRPSSPPPEAHRYRSEPRIQRLRYGGGATIKRTKLEGRDPDDITGDKGRQQAQVRRTY